MYPETSDFRRPRTIAAFACMVTTLVSAASCAGTIKPVSDACRLPKNVFEEVSAARGLPFRSDVECRYETTDEIRRYLLEALWKKNPLEKLLFEGELYHALGLIPADYHYLERVPDFFSQEISGYYKAEDDSYVMRNGSDPATERDTMRHELTHALQDQHFDIEALLPADLSTDELLARTAVLEGDADRVMLHLSGVDPCAELEELSVSVGGKTAPPALRVFLNFPYVYGRRFWCALAGDSEAASRVMSDLPRSTREIMHPELYLSENEQLKGVQPAIEPDPRFGTPIYQEIIGELGALAVLAAYLPVERARAAAFGLIADRAWVFKELNPETTSVVWKTMWQSPAEAQEFERALLTVNKLRFAAAPSVVDVGGPKVSYFNVAAQGLDHLSIARDGAVVELTALKHVEPLRP